MGMPIDEQILCADGTVVRPPLTCDDHDGYCDVKCGSGDDAPLAPGCNSQKCPPDCHYTCADGSVPEDCDTANCPTCIQTECTQPDTEWDPISCSCQCTRSGECGCLAGEWVTADGECVCASPYDGMECGPGKVYMFGGCCTCVRSGEPCGNRPGFATDSNCDCLCATRGNDCRNRRGVIGTVGPGCECAPRCAYPSGVTGHTSSGKARGGHYTKDCTVVWDWTQGAGCYTTGGVPGTVDSLGNCEPSCTPGLQQGCPRGQVRSKTCGCVPICKPGSPCGVKGYYDGYCDCKDPGCTPYTQCAYNKHYDYNCFCVSDCTPGASVYNSDGIHGVVKDTHCNVDWDCIYRDPCTTKDGTPGVTGLDCSCVGNCSSVGAKCNTDPDVDKRFTSTCACKCAHTTRCLPGKHFDENSCACVCDEPREECSYGYHFDTSDCSCHCDKEKAPCGDSEDSGRVYDKYCNCPSCSQSDKETCEANTDKGAVWHDDPTCKCDCDSADPSCTVARSSSPYDGIVSGSGSGTYDEYCNCDCEEGDPCTFTYRSGDLNCGELHSASGTFDSNCDCRCSKGGSCTFCDWTGMSYDGQFSSDCYCTCKPHTECSYVTFSVPSGSSDPSEGEFDDYCNCYCKKGGRCNFRNEHGVEDYGEFDGSCNCKCEDGSPCPGYKNQDGVDMHGVHNSDCSCRCDKDASCHFMYAGVEYTGEPDDECRCRCKPGSDCRYTYDAGFGPEEADGKFDEDCSCKCIPGSACFGTDEYGASFSGTFTESCACTACDSYSDCKNGGSWKESQCECDCSTASCGEGARLVSGSDTCECECDEGWDGTYPNCSKDESCPSGKTFCQLDSNCYFEGEEYCTKCGGGCWDGSCHGGDGKTYEKGWNNRCNEVGTELWCYFRDQHSEWCGDPPSCVDRNDDDYCEKCRESCRKADGTCANGLAEKCLVCVENSCFRSEDNKCVIIGAPCGCGDSGTIQQSDCKCSVQDEGEKCGCDGTGTVQEDCSCSKPLAGDSCGCGGTVEAVTCNCINQTHVIGSSCGTNKVWKDCDTCDCIDGYEKCGDACYAENTSDWCEHCVTGGCWEDATSACHQDDQYACEHCVTGGCWLDSVCKTEGGTCSVTSGDCAGYDGAVQSDCSCAIDCDDGTHPGDECAKGTGTGKLDCLCGCKCDEDAKNKCECIDEFYAPCGTWDDSNCSCDCGDSERFELGSDGHCVCKETDEKRNCTGDDKHWNGTDCKCECNEDKSEGDDCEVDGVKGKWKAFPTCACDTSGDCQDEKQSATACLATGGSWIHEDCRCDCTSAECKTETADHRCACPSHMTDPGDVGPCSCTAPKVKSDDCDCKCSKEDIAHCKNISRGELNSETCKCCSGNDKYFCTQAEGEGAWNPETCDCTCGNPNHSWNSRVHACRCPQKDDYIAACRKRGTWDKENCTCDCAEAAKAKESGCTTSGGSWDTTKPCDCDCGKNKVTDSSGMCVCDPEKETACRKRGRGVWDTNSCTCSCTGNYVLDGKSGECICMTESGKHACEASDSKGQWDTDEKPCECTCPANKILSGGKCKCNSDAGRNACIAKDSGGQWDTKAKPCACDCSGIKNKEESGGVCVCTQAAETSAKPPKSECGRGDYAGATWNKGTCSCNCKTMSEEQRACTDAKGNKGRRDDSCACVVDDCDGSEKCFTTADDEPLALYQNVAGHRRRDEKGNCKCVRDCTPGSDLCDLKDCQRDDGTPCRKNKRCQCDPDCDDKGDCATKTYNCVSNGVAGAYNESCECIACCKPGGDCFDDEGNPGKYTKACLCKECQEDGTSPCGDGPDADKMMWKDCDCVYKCEKGYLEAKEALPGGCFANYQASDCTKMCAGASETNCAGTAKPLWDSCACDCVPCPVSEDQLASCQKLDKENASNPCGIVDDPDAYNDGAGNIGRTGWTNNYYIAYDALRSEFNEFMLTVSGLTVPAAVSKLNIDTDCEQELYKTGHADLIDINSRIEEYNSSVEYAQALKNKTDQENSNLVELMSAFLNIDCPATIPSVPSYTGDATELKNLLSTLNTTASKLSQDIATVTSICSGNKACTPDSRPMCLGTVTGTYKSNPITECECNCDVKSQQMADDNAKWAAAHPDSKGCYKWKDYANCRYTFYAVC